MASITNYHPHLYNRRSFSNILGFVFCDLMIRYDRLGHDALMATNAEVVQIRQRIEAAYRGQHGRNPVAVNAMAEGVLLWMREGATVADVIAADDGVLIQRGREAAARE